jgi:hypothetical protein
MRHQPQLAEQGLPVSCFYAGAFLLKCGFFIKGIDI